MLVRLKSPEAFPCFLHGGGGQRRPQAMRWRESMGRVEAPIFASPAPVTRDALAKLVGRACNLDHLMSDIRDDLRRRPYELVSVVGGYAPPQMCGAVSRSIPPGKSSTGSLI